MEVNYTQPKIGAKGTYIFPDPTDFTEMLGETIYVGGITQLNNRQDNILHAADRMVDFMQKYQLPEGINGKARVGFRVCDAKKGFFSRPIGKIGYPKVFIETDLGDSELYLWPHDHGSFVSIEYFGDFAKNMVESLMSDFESFLGKKAYSEKFDSRSNRLTLSGRVNFETA